MTCRECEELIAAAERDGGAGRLTRRAEAHVAGCSACRGFRAQLSLVFSDLAGWQAPVPDPRAVATCTAELIARFRPPASPAPFFPDGVPPVRRRDLIGGAVRHPGLIGVLGALALAAGAAIAPPWLQQVTIGWAAFAAITGSLVLVFHGRPLPCEGELT